MTTSLAPRTPRAGIPTSIDSERSRFADRLADRRRRLEAARAMRRAIRAGAARDLAMFEHYGLVDRLRIEARGDTCASCARLAGRSYSFEHAANLLPSRECVNPLGWCDCRWAAERRRHSHVEHRNLLHRRRAEDGLMDEPERPTEDPLFAEVRRVLLAPITPEAEHAALERVLASLPAATANVQRHGWSALRRRSITKFVAAGGAFTICAGVVALVLVR